MLRWPKSPISSYTCWFRHWLSFIILASSCSDLFVVIKVSWIWVSSSLISFKEKLDRRFDKSSSFFDFVSGFFVIFHCFIFERLIDNRCPSLFEIFQQFEYFPVAFAAQFIISASTQSLSLLSWYLMVECGFNFFIDCERCGDVFSFRGSVVMTVVRVNIVLWFQMGGMFMMNILVDIAAELIFQMNMRIEWYFQMKMMNVMALVLYYGCFPGHQKILSQCHMFAVCFR